MALIKCKECGKDVSDMATACPNCGCPIGEISYNKLDTSAQSSTDYNALYDDEPKHKHRHVWKLVSGILSIILFVVVSLQSCAVGVANSLTDNGEISGSAGIVVAILMLTGGIVSVATSGSSSKGSNIALIILFGLASLVGFANAGSYKDLNVWAFWCLICAALALIAFFTNKGQADTEL